MKHGITLKTIDLFAGCGGLSLGFKNAGFDMCGHIEKETAILETLMQNLHNGRNDDIAVASDITQVQDPLSFVKKFGIDQISVILGGPPCQAYSLAGRAKINSLGNDKESYLNDTRGNLFQYYLHFVKALNPAIIVMENVPESMAYGKRNIPEEMCEVLDSLGYQARYSILNAASYGVPQYRERMILIALRNDLELIPTFPKPEYSLEENVKLRQNLSGIAGKGKLLHAVYTPLLEEGPPPITCEEAISDLPFISYYPTKKNICERNNSLLPYRLIPQNEYQRMMRDTENKNLEFVANNLIRYTQRDFPIFARMKEGDLYPQAVEIAKNLKEEYLKKATTNYSKDELLKIDKLFIPPYNVDAFTSKWRVLSRNKPSHTILAHLSVDTYSHIHYDSAQARGISVREAARLQSFPDSFIFPSNMAYAFKEIGNAVPPILSYKIAQHIRKYVGL